MNTVRRWNGLAAGLGLTLAAIAILGYHPYAEDGGLYLAEVKHVLDPALYPHATEFVTGHLRAGVFDLLVAGLVRATGFNLDVVMFLVQVLCVGGLLVGVWLFARACYPAPQAQAGAVALVAITMSMPIAGTSLMLMDPYVTARSVVMALVVLGLACLAAGGRQLWAAVALAAGVIVHPLMGGFGVGAAWVLLCLKNPRRSVRLGGIVTLALLTLLVAWMVQRYAPPESADYLRVARTRYYWFLAEWHWYEWFGLAGPMAILSWVALRGRLMERDLARMCLVMGCLGVMIAAGFALEAASVHAVARLQPLRCFQIIYLVLLVVLGARLGEFSANKSIWSWSLASILLAGGMFAVQRQTFPASDHLELPGRKPRNQWEQAFVWVREQTPRDAFFALDADYVHRPEEDVQGFRAIAERSALPDYSKDGGQVSIRPELTAAWVMGQQTESRLSEETDAERIAALRGTGVSWVVLERKAITHFDCPYRNAAVLVCQVP